MTQQTLLNLVLVVDDWASSTNRVSLLSIQKLFDCTPSTATRPTPQTRQKWYVISSVRYSKQYLEWNTELDSSCSCYTCLNGIIPNTHKTKCVKYSQWKRNKILCIHCVFMCMHVHVKCHVCFLMLSHEGWNTYTAQIILIKLIACGVLNVYLDDTEGEWFKKLENREYL